MRSKRFRLSAREIMNNKKSAVLATFENIGAVNAAVNRLRQAGLRQITLYSPVPIDELQGDIAMGESGIGFLALGGAVIGATAGLLLTMGTSLQWPLITGGQPIT